MKINLQRKTSGYPGTGCGDCACDIGGQGKSVGVRSFVVCHISAIIVLSDERINRSGDSSEFNISRGIA